MIDVNFTLIIQMINFFICFLMLKYLLFKPAAKYLQIEQKREEAFEEKILVQEDIIKDKIAQKNKTWANHVQYFKTNCPKPTVEKYPTLKELPKEPSNMEISSQEIDALANHAQKALIERIDHARK